ncbi:MAG: C-terminal target protein [Akkermansiaceae bacterium]|nr:C-terminal target protein [Akkermansiaceae bacterium]
MRDSFLFTDVKALLPLAALWLIAGASSAATIVPVDSTDHSSGLSTPIRNEPRTLQMVFSASLLSGIPTGSEISGLGFRLFGGTSFAWPLEAASWVQYDIQLSSSRNAPGSLSPVFDENIGADAVMVRSGALEMVTGNFPAGGSPNAFGAAISFSTPFIYKGTDLLITIRHSGNGTSGDTPLESTSTAGAYQLLTGSGYDAETGTENEMLVTQLIYTVPESSTLGIVTVGACLMLFRRSPRQFAA